MLLFALLSAQQLPPIALPSAAQSQTLERSEVDHVLVVTLAYLQMDGQPLIPLDQGSVPLAGRPGLEAALEVPRRADGACPERATLLVVADRRVPSFTMQVLETELKGSCFFRCLDAGGDRARLRAPQTFRARLAARNADRRGAR